MSGPDKRILALDLGARRIGVAVSDPGRILAQPLCVIQRRNRDRDLRAIAELARRHQAELIVVGLPRQADDSLGPAGQGMLRFARRLQRVLGIPVETVDEWETTVEATQVLLEADVSRRGRRRVVDKLAAGLILKRYLEQGGERLP